MSKYVYKTIHVNPDSTYLINQVRLSNPNPLILCLVCVGFADCVYAKFSLPIIKTLRVLWFGLVLCKTRPNYEKFMGSIVSWRNVW